MNYASVNSLQDTGQNPTSDRRFYLSTANYYGNIAGCAGAPDALCPAIAHQVNLGHTAPSPSSIGLCR